MVDIGSKFEETKKGILSKIAEGCGDDHFDLDLGKETFTCYLCKTNFIDTIFGGCVVRLERPIGNTTLKQTYGVCFSCSLDAFSEEYLKKVFGP